MIDRILSRAKETSDDVSAEDLSQSDFLRVLLYSPPERDGPEGIPGPFTLSLATFVAAEKYEIITGTPAPFEFQSSDTGPRSEELDATLDRLVDEVVVCERLDTDRQHDTHLYSHADSGLERTRTLYEALSPRTQSEFAQIRASAVDEIQHFVLDAHTLGPELFDEPLIRTG